MFGQNTLDDMLWRQEAGHTLVYTAKQCKGSMQAGVNEVCWGRTGGTWKTRLTSILLQEQFVKAAYTL